MAKDEPFWNVNSYEGKATPFFTISDITNELFTNVDEYIVFRLKLADPTLVWLSSKIMIESNKFSTTRSDRYDTEIVGVPMSQLSAYKRLDVPRLYHDLDLFLTPQQVTWNSKIDYGLTRSCTIAVMRS